MKKTIKCSCGGTAEIMFIAFQGFDTKGRKFIFSSRENTSLSEWEFEGKKTTSMSVYSCEDCHQETVVMNQTKGRKK